MQKPNVQVISQGVVMAFSNQASQQPSANSHRSTPLLGPIKVVDMKKLLKTPVKSETETCVQEMLPPTHARTIWSASQTEANFSNTIQDGKLNVSNASLQVTISQVLDCLKVILPVKFDLSKLIPNEKVATLVIRYLKIPDNPEVRNSVKLFLKIIVDSSKTKEKLYGNDLSHPYLKINDVALQLALEKVLPTNFSMSDLSNQVLNCLCIVLNQDIFSDGHHILRRKIRQFTSEGQKFSEIINQVSGNRPLTSEIGGANKKIKHSNNQTYIKPIYTETMNLVGSQTPKSKKLKVKPVGNYAIPVSSVNIKNKMGNFSGSFNAVRQENNKILQKVRNKEINKKIDFDIIPENSSDVVSTSLSSDSKSLNNSAVTLVSKTNVKEDCNKSQYQNQERFRNEKSNFNSEKKPVIKAPENLRNIVSYLEKEKCSAKDVLENFRLMFYLCRFLNVRSKTPTLQKLKELLNLILKKNINKGNVIKMEQKLFPEGRNSLSHVIQKKNQQEIRPFISADKLRLKPVVVLRDLADYKEEDLLFMKDKKKDLQKQKSYHNQIVPFCFQQNVSMQKYSTEYVNKITFNNYKQFRKIISKSIGNKVVFRLSYVKLEPGSHVFVRDFQKPVFGWVKGTVEKMKGRLKCQVQLENGETLCCSMEQLRPIPDIETSNPSHSGSPRIPRLVKPKQLFDL